MQNSYCDHRNFDSVNQPFKKSVIRKCTSFRVPELAISVIGCTQKCWTIIVETYISNCFTVPWNKTNIIIDPSVKNLRLYYKSSHTLKLKEWRFNSWLVVIVLYLTKRLLALQLLSSNHKFMYMIEWCQWKLYGKCRDFWANKDLFAYSAKKTR
jgi:hypothetical protein